MDATPLAHSAWHYLHGFKKKFWLSIGYAIGFLLLLCVLLSPLYWLGRTLDILPPIVFLISLIVSYFILPVGFGFLTLSIRHIAHETTPLSTIFAHYQQGNMGVLLVYTTGFFGLFAGLLFIPSWAVRILLILSFPVWLLVWLFSGMYFLEKKISLWLAFKNALRLVTTHPLKVIGIVILIGIGLLLGFFTAFLGFIWITPWITHLLALFYLRYGTPEPTL